MTQSKIYQKLLAVLAAIFIFVLAGCDNSTVEPDPGEPTTDQAAFEKLADEDSAIASFEPNYNEDGLSGILGKVSTDIYPLKVGQRMRLVNRTLSVDIAGDTAYGTLTKTFEGVLFIAASYDSGATEPDTIVQKPFTTVITRKVIFIRIANTPRPWRNWKIAAISLPEGGTPNRNIDITKATIIFSNGDEIAITSPNDFFLSRGPQWWRQLPSVLRGDSVKIRVEVTSSYEENDFVTLTFGADGHGLNRAKRKFELVSTTPAGGVYLKVYEQYFRANLFPGFFHAIINAFPKQVIFDDAAPVESESWGIPYHVRLF
jgi:hypothetical protein